MYIPVAGERREGGEGGEGGEREMDGKREEGVWKGGRREREREERRREKGRRVEGGRREDDDNQDIRFRRVGDKKYVGLFQARMHFAPSRMCPM